MSKPIVWNDITKLPVPRYPDPYNRMSVPILIAHGSPGKPVTVDQGIYLWDVDDFGSSGRYVMWKNFGWGHYAWDTLNAKAWADMPIFPEAEEEGVAQ